MAYLSSLSSCHFLRKSSILLVTSSVNIISERSISACCTTSPPSLVITGIPLVVT